MCVWMDVYGCEWMGICVWGEGGTVVSGWGGGERCGCVSGGVGMGVSGWVCVAMGASGCVCGYVWVDGYGCVWVCGFLLPLWVNARVYVHLTVCTPYWFLRTVIHQNPTSCLVLCIVLTAFHKLKLYKLLLLKSSSLMGTGSQCMWVSPCWMRPSNYQLVLNSCFLHSVTALFILLILLPFLLHSDWQFKLHITSHCVGYDVGLATNHLNKGWLQQMNTRCAALNVYYYV